MRMTAKDGISTCVIGLGVIGTQFIREAEERGYSVCRAVNSSGVYDLSDAILCSYLSHNARSGDGSSLSAYLQEHPEFRVGERGDHERLFGDANVVVLAISTRDDGAAAREYLRARLDSPSKPLVITCEKGALSAYFTDFADEVAAGRLGYRATVGAGIGMPKYVQDVVKPGYRGTIAAVANGTLNFMMDGPDSLAAMAAEAQRLNYAEPGAVTALDVLNAELGDVGRKAVILANTDLLAQKKGGYVTFDRVRHATEYITPSTLGMLEDNRDLRFVIRIGPRDGSYRSRIGGFSVPVGDCVLKGGFMPLPDERLRVPGVTNALLITENGNTLVYETGPGAGPAATVSSMFRDLADMRTHGLFER